MSSLDENIIKGIREDYLDKNISIDEITSFPSHKVIVYTSWRHLDIVYSNPLKIEVTLYDPVTENTLTRWNSATDRIILGIFNFELWRIKSLQQLIEYFSSENFRI